MKRSASFSEIAAAKNRVFEEIEKRVIKIMDELDGLSSSAELILYDPGITYAKQRHDAISMQAELDDYRHNRENVCHSTPAYEKISKTSTHLQQTLSNLLTAFQSSDTCMADFKVARDTEGSVDLRQLDALPAFFKKSCGAGRASASESH